MQQRCGALDVNGAQCVLLAGHAGDHALGPPAPPGVAQPVQAVAPAKKEPFRWVRSWQFDTWVLVVGALGMAGIYLWSQVQLASWCPDSVPDQAACRDLQFWTGPAYVLGPVALVWLIYLIVWGIQRLWSLLRRPR